MMGDNMFDYLGQDASTMTPNNPSQQSGGFMSGFMNNLGGAFGRSSQAGGGLAGLLAALSPSFAQGNKQAGVNTSTAPMQWPGGAGQQSQGLRF